MRWKQIEDEPKVFALILETGAEIAACCDSSRSARAGGNWL
jgi:hypothetical protein